MTYEHQDKSLTPTDHEMLYAFHHKLLDNPEGQSWIRLWKYGLLDDRFKNLLSAKVKKHQRQNKLTGIPLANPQQIDGNLRLGYSHQNKPIQIPHQYLNAHSLVMGGSGCGKTTRSIFIAAQMLLFCMIWLFDLRKREYHKILPVANRLNKTVRVVEGHSIKLNPLQIPEGVSAMQWANQLSAMLVNTLNIPSRAARLLEVHLIKLYERDEIIDASATSYPTLVDVFHAVRIDKTANAQARQAITDRLEPLILSMSDQLDYNYGWSVSDLTKHNIIFELSDLSEIGRSLILNTLILATFNTRLAARRSNCPMDLWIGFDEAEQLCTSKSDTPNPIADQIGLVRGIGVGLDLSVLSASQIHTSIINNAGTRWLGRCGSYSDLNVAARSMGLTSEQIRWAQHHLQPGQFIIQLSEGPWRYPFLAQLPSPDPGTGGNQNTFNSKSPSLGTHQLGNSSHQAKNAEPFPEFTTRKANRTHTKPSASSQAPDPVASPGSSSPQTASASPETPISDQALRLLKSVNAQPLLPSSKYAAIAGISTRSAVSARKELIDQGYLKERPLAQSGRGRRSLLLEITPEGEAIIRTCSTQSEGGQS